MKSLLKKGLALLAVCVMLTATISVIFSWELPPKPQPPFETYTITTAGGSHNWSVPVTYNLVKETMDIVYVIDTTGSMTSQLWTVAEALSAFTSDLYSLGASNIYFGVAFYGDFDYDDYPSLNLYWFGITLPMEKHELTTVQDAITFLTTTGGGDTPEDTVWAYMRTIAETNWREGSQRVIVLITDAPTKERPSEEVDGFPVTVDGAAAITDKYGIDLVLASYGNYTYLDGSNSNPDFIGAMGVTEYRWTNQTQLESALHQAITPPAGLIVDFAYEARVISTTYLSDGTSSSDVSISISPAFILSESETEHFDFVATAAAIPNRYNDTTIVEIGFFIDGERYLPATQYIRYRLDTHGVFYHANTTDSTSPVHLSSDYPTGATVVVLPDLTRSLYTFKGWNTDPLGLTGDWYYPGDTFIMPDSDVNLYAQWQALPKENPEPDTGDNGLVRFVVTISLISSLSAFYVLKKRNYN